MRKKTKGKVHRHTPACAYAHHWPGNSPRSTMWSTLGAAQYRTALRERQARRTLRDTRCTSGATYGCRMLRRIRCREPSLSTPRYCTPPCHWQSPYRSAPCSHRMIGCVAAHRQPCSSCWAWRTTPTRPRRRPHHTAPCAWRGRFLDKIRCSPHKCVPASCCPCHTQRRTRTCRPKLSTPAARQPHTQLAEYPARRNCRDSPHTSASGCACRCRRPTSSHPH
jgi:hypothetical protein